jgi:hypothetical protein
MQDNNHSFCRLHLRGTIEEIVNRTTPEQRKAAWAWKDRNSPGRYEFHGPNNFYWYGQSCCLWEAKSQGWSAWLREQGATPAPEPVKQWTIVELARQYSYLQTRSRLCKAKSPDSKCIGRAHLFMFKVDKRWVCALCARHAAMEIEAAIA